MSLINYQISGALRETGKKVSMDWTSWASCPCPPELVPSHQVENCQLPPSEQWKGLSRLWWKRKLNDQAEKNEGTQTRNPGSALLATQHIRLRKSWQLESRNQEDTLTAKLKSSEAKCKARRVLSGDLTPPPLLLILGSLVAASLSEGSWNIETIEPWSPLERCGWCGSHGLPPTNSRCVPGTLVSCSPLAHLCSVDIVPQLQVQGGCPPTFSSWPLPPHLALKFISWTQEIRSQSPSCSFQLVHFTCWEDNFLSDMIWSTWVSSPDFCVDINSQMNLQNSFFK